MCYLGYSQCVGAVLAVDTSTLPYMDIVRLHLCPVHRFLCVFVFYLKRKNQHVYFKFTKPYFSMMMKLYFIDIS